MITKCHVCGKTLLAFFKSAKTCPKCGSNLAITKSVPANRNDTEVQFPQRENSSLEDGLKRKWTEGFEGGNIGQTTVYDTWEDIVGRRRFDAPYYTALKNRACIIIHFSSQYLDSEEQLEALLHSGLGFPMQIETFLKGRFPIIRCNLVIPDDPTNPFCLEAPLNIRDGDVQDFFRAALENEYIDLIAKHEVSRAGKYYAVECHAPGISKMVEREVKRAIQALRPSSSREDFRAGIKVMEASFSSAIDGVDPRKSIILRVCGKAQNEMIWYGGLFDS